jgi:D-alanyl-D-alanine carboxypeptidase (penicillin-binding protein 5/6)
MRLFLTSLPLGLLLAVSTLAFPAPAVAAQHHKPAPKAGPAKTTKTAPAEAAPAAPPGPLTGLAAVTNVPPPPPLAAKSYVLVDAFSNEVIAGVNDTQRVEPASLTKLMTAYVVFHALQDGKLKLDQDVPISEYAWRVGGAKSGGSTSFLDLGSRVKVVDLIQGMIVQSGNDASIALAEAVAGDERTFAVLMNQYSKKLGMTGSSWTNSPGLPDPNHYTTARDLALLSAAIIREFPQHYRYYSQRSFTYNGITQQNRNGLLEKDPTVDGIKTGHTESAGYCLAASALRNGMRLVSVVMGTDGFTARENASAALLGYGFNFFETKKLYTAGQQVGEAHVWKVGDPVPVVVKNDLYTTAPRGQLDGVKAQLVLNPKLVAPLAANQPVGKVKLTIGDKTLTELNAFPKAAVEPSGFFRSTIDTVRLWFN